MLNIIVDGKRAVLKKGISFEFVAENSAFTKSDSYTLEITFPLKDCRDNIDIFGMLFRKDFSPKSLMFDCVISDKAFQKKGSLIIIEFNESEVKCQFLEGRSGEKLTSPIADLYINEMQIASPSNDKSVIAPSAAWSPNNNCVALPWVNNVSGNIQNKVNFNYNTKQYYWADATTGLSWMPYLTFVIEKICENIGYSCNIKQFSGQYALRFLLICNVLPEPWGVREVARALPHWTVQEFFEKLGDFACGDFEIDHTNKSVTFVYNGDRYQNAPQVDISTDINEFSAEVFVKDSECAAIDVCNIKYKEADHRLQKFYDCSKAVERLVKEGRTMNFDSLDKLIQFVKGNYVNLNFESAQCTLYHVKDIDRYFGLSVFWKNPTTQEKVWGLRIINDFGERIVNTDPEAKSKELEFVPACIDYTEPLFGFTLFNDPGDFSEDYGHDRTAIEEELELMGLDIGKSEYYDKIFLGWWFGDVQFEGKNPFPNVHDLLGADIDIIKTCPVNLRLDAPESIINKGSRNIDISVKYNISFITDSLPSPRSIFLIKGKKYVCEKLTANITERGMSQLVKGVFWRLND